MVTSLINIDYKNQNAECIIDIGEKDYWGNKSKNYLRGCHDVLSKKVEITQNGTR